jgi:hypothetical protein
MKIIFAFLLIVISTEVLAQDILLQQNVKADSVRPSYGPNLENYFYGYIGIGFPVYTNEVINYTKFGSSAAFDFGLRYKRKITNYLAVGADAGISPGAYKLKQNEGKSVPDTIINDREKFQITSFLSSAYMRINVGRRGNFIGNYFDLGMYGSWNAIKKHKTYNDNAEGEKVKSVTSGLKYIDNFSYGVLTRFGESRYALTASYRLSDIFVSSFAMPELPRLIVGIEMGLFR